MDDVRAVVEAIARGAALVRQPVADAAGVVRGYRLRLRTPEGQPALLDDRSRWETEALLDGVEAVGLGALVPTGRIYLDVGTSFLHTDLHRRLPPGRVVLCLHEDSPVDGELTRRASALAGRGFRLALVDFFWRPELSDLLRAADLVRLTVRRQPLDAAVTSFSRFAGHVRWWADGVRTPAIHDALSSAGVVLFSGPYWTSAPEQGEPLARGARRLLSWLTDPELGPADLSGLVSGPLERTVVEGLLVETGQPSADVAQALASHGLALVHRWALMAALARLERIAPEALALALVRARSCWWLSEPAQAEEAFLAGLGSLLPAALRSPPAELSRAVHLLVSSDHRATVQAVAAWERADWARATLPPERLTEAHVAAVSWLRRVEPILLG